MTMKLKVNLLNTFIKKWPISFVKPEHLADCGFFYLHSKLQNNSKSEDVLKLFKYFKVTK